MTYTFSIGVNKNRLFWLLWCRVYLAYLRFKKVSCLLINKVRFTQ